MPKSYPLIVEVVQVGDLPRGGRLERLIDQLSRQQQVLFRLRNESGINRRSPNRAIEIGEVMAQVAPIEALINAAQKVIGRDGLEEIKTFYV